jgi:thioredoxin 1
MLSLHRAPTLLSVLFILSVPFMSPAVAAADGVTSLDPAGLEQVLANGKYSLIEFGGKRCIPCKAMQPRLHTLSVTYSDRLNVFNVYMDEQPDLLRKYKIQLIPTQVLFNRKGVEVSRHVGLWEENEMLEQLKKLGVVK